MNYTKDIIKILKNSEIEAKKFKNEFVSSEHILLSLLKIETKAKQLFNKHNITYNEAEKLIKKSNANTSNNYYTLTTKKIIDNAFVTNKDNSSEITPINLTLSILDEKNSKAYTILQTLSKDINLLYKDFVKELTKSENNILTELGTNLNELVINNEIDKVIGRDSEIERIIEILARKNKNNPILIGEAGVGKTAIVEELARRIVTKNIPPILKNKIIISINLASIISGTKYRGEFEEKMNKIVKELENNNNIILFIDEIHTIVGAGGAEGAIDASNILKPMLARGKAKCIGATTINEYKKTIEKDKALDRRFQKIIIEEPNEKEIINILSKIKSDYEKFHNVRIPNEILKQIPILSKKYIFGRSEPDKSIDILDEVCAKTSIFANTNEIEKINRQIKTLNKRKNNYIKEENYNFAIKLSEDINALNEKLEKINNKNIKTVTVDILKMVIEKKSNIKIYDVNNQSYFNEIKNKLNKKIIAQEKQINKLIELYIDNLNKTSTVPNSILIEGPTGTGKTELIKLLAKYTNKNLIKINMDEYKSEISINRIIGSPQGYVGYNDTNTTFEELKIKPNSIILIENINEAHYTIKNLFKNILEDGILKNSKNEIINLANNLIIFTNTKNNTKNSIGFISNQLKEDKNMLKIENKIIMNNLKEKDIIKIIKSKSKLKDIEIKEIIKKSNYIKEGANNLDKLIKKLQVAQIS